MPISNFVEYSDNYLKTLGSLWQFYKDEPNYNSTDLESFKSKDVETIMLLKHLSNFWRTLEMPLINCEVNLILKWSPTCVITNSSGAGRFAITDTQLYVPVVTLSTQDNAKLLQQLKFGFKKNNYLE